MTEFNPCEQSIKLIPNRSPLTAQQEVVNVTTTEGGRQEVRQRNIYEATIDIADDGDYAILLDVGQQMARRHNLSIDGQNVIEMQNMWLPPTASTIVRLKAGHHVLKAEIIHYLDLHSLSSIQTALPYTYMHLINISG